MFNFANVNVSAYKLSKGDVTTGAGAAGKRMELEEKQIINEAIIAQRQLANSAGNQQN